MAKQHEDELREALQFFEKLNPTIIRYDQQRFAKELRNEVHANWLDSFMTTIQNSGDSNMINKETGLRHTVDSLVAELQVRVGLDSIRKKAQTIALSKHAKPDEDNDDISDEDLIKKIKADIELMGLRPTGGFISTESLLDSIKERFGEQVIERFGRDKLIELVTKWRDQVKDMTDVDNLPPYDGQPVPMGAEQNDPANDMFSNLELPGK